MCHILIVEDNSDIQDYLSTIVSSEGYECATCSTAEEAEALMMCWKPDLALIDICLPRQHGVSLCWKIRQTYPDVPIAIISAVLESWDEEDLFDCGASAVIDKTIPVKEMIDSITKLLEKVAIA
jgi:DNA-binding response OmpR family regulator